MQVNGLDSRYSIDLEFCGYETPHYVVRFCGDWVGSMDNAQNAEQLAISHNKKRLERL